MPLFKDPNLQKAYEKNKESVANNELVLKLINENIKQLEKYLRTQILLSYTMKIELKNKVVHLNFSSGRLICIEENDARPLIETKMTMRLEVAPYLPTFLENVLKHSEIVEGKTWTGDTL